MNPISSLTRWALPASLYMLDDDRGTWLRKVGRDSGGTCVRLDHCMAREAGPGQPVVTEGSGRRRGDGAGRRPHDDKRLRIARCDVVDDDLERHRLSFHL